MKPEKTTENQRIIDSYDYLEKAVSSMDCTGLIPAPVQTDSELEAYQELYPFLTKASDTKDT